MPEKASRSVAAMRRRWKLVTAALVVGAVTALAAFGAAGSPSKAAARQGGIARSASSAIRSGARSASTQAQSTNPIVGTGHFDGSSPLVSGLPVLPVSPATQIRSRDNENLHPQAQPTGAKDPVVQKQKGSGPISAPIASFDGICLPGTAPCAQASSCSCLPPDTNGEVGATQYVQMVNSDFAVYSKAGKVLRPATPIDQLWKGTNSECATHNDGDPVVVYDQLAKRWLLTQFIASPATGESYGECVAVSKTSDATGAYYLYTFLLSPSVFLDYPKFGVWPDGYYMSANEFPDGSETSSGAAAIVFERSQMIKGGPARYVWFDESASNPPGSQYIGQLPGDLDGTTAPPAGQPNLFAEVDDPSTIPVDESGAAGGFTMRLWKYHVDWTNPSSSTFGNAGQPSYQLPVAAFVRPQCTYGYGPNCPPQKGGPQGLDTLGDRLMFRLAYRQFSGYGSLLLNHTVTTDDRDGIRWYEVRVPTTGTPSINQQGTYSPADSVTNPLWRWMGSIAEDKKGDIALGFSASGPNDYPSIRYTGRLAGDPLGLLTQGENVAFTGTGPQTEAEGRWGDYSDMTVDPADDCTFFYTQEYLATDTVVLGTWRTRVVSFRFPGCTTR